MRCALLFLSVLFCLPESVTGQVYSNQIRPPGQNWQELQSEHFRIIYPAGLDSVAYRSAKILEKQYPGVRNLVGGKLQNFPVILNTESDMSNGFVSPFNFRSEVTVPPARGKNMNPRSGDWLDLVLPHELVHALHLNVQPSGLTSVLGMISPDIRRSVHTAAPIGILEGVAVEYESHHIIEGGGRGNHPFFTSRFQTTLGSGNEWSMGQLFHRPGSTHPFNRHYAGSYIFFHWMQNRYGDSTAKKAIEFHYQWPFLGFGTSLRRVTGEWPRSLYHSFIEDMKDYENERLKKIGETTTGQSFFIEHNRKGATIRRPIWLDNNRILMHGSFYNSPTGFYVYERDNRSFDLILEHRIVEDYHFSVDTERQELYFADYIADGKYDQTYRSGIFRYNLENQEKTSLSEERLFSPSPGDPFMALQTAGSVNRLVSLKDDDLVSVIAKLPETASITEVQQHSHLNNLLAVIARKGTEQALWVSDSSHLQETLQKAPDILFEEGSLFDLAWHPLEKRILFSSDHTGVLNVYEYDLTKGQVFQITRSSHGAFEASFSPDGDQIAYVVHQHNNYLPAILQQDDFLNRELPASEWSSSDTVDMAAGSFSEQEVPLNSESGLYEQNDWQVQPYRTGISWLKPRTILPDYNRLADGTSLIGLQLSSTDLLGRHTYSMAGQRSHNRYWQDLHYTYSGFHPGFGFNLFNRPRFSTLRGDRQFGEPVQFLLQDRGASFHIPFRYTFDRNTRLTSLSVTPGYKISQVRFFQPEFSESPLTNFGNLHALSLRVVFNYRIRQHIRDTQPNSGWVLFGLTDYDLNDLPFDFTHNGATFANTFVDRKGLRLGVYRYLAPFGRWNQSLRIGVQLLTQTEFGQYESRSLVSDAFGENIYPGATNLGFFDTRYTIPLAWPDDGGLLVPAYISHFYLVLFSQTVSKIDSDFIPGSNHSRTAVGAGIRAVFRLSNITFDLGVGFGYEPTRSQWSFIPGHF